MRGSGINVSSDEKLMEIWWMAECDWKDQIRDVITFFEDTPHKMKTRMVGGD